MNFHVALWLEKHRRTYIGRDVIADNWAHAVAITREMSGEKKDIVLVGVWDSPVTWAGTIETLPPKGDVYFDDAGNALRADSNRHFKEYTVVGLSMEPNGVYNLDTAITETHIIRAASWSSAAYIAIHGFRGELGKEYLFIGAAMGRIRRVAQQMDLANLLLDADEDEELAAQIGQKVMR